MSTIEDLQSAELPECFICRVGLFTHSDLCPYMHAADTRFYTAYILSARLFKCRCAARQTVVSAEWERWGKKQGNREKAAAVKGIILDDEFWAAMQISCRTRQAHRTADASGGQQHAYNGKGRALSSSCKSVWNNFLGLSLTGRIPHAGLPHVCSD